MQHPDTVGPGASNPPEPTRHRATSAVGDPPEWALASEADTLGALIPPLPSGTVTFLFTDIEGSTQLWDRLPHAMATAVARHDELLRAVVTAHQGHVFKTLGDGICAAFQSTLDALEAAIDAQRTLKAEPWLETGPLRVRMAIHVSHTEERDADYFGRPLNRLARLLATGHGSQILLSAAARGVLHANLPHDVRLRDLGEHRLKDLMDAEHIYQVVVPDLPVDFPPIKSLGRSRHNLPVQLTPFIGREREVQEVTHLFLDSRVRLVTLTGPGGIGKTRLGLQVASELSDSFPDGVCWVPLAAAHGPDDVGSAIAVALALHDRGTGPIVEVLKKHLEGANLLLLLDNFEHVVGAATLIADLLSTCPDLSVLVTSRESLMIAGEHVFAIPTMNMPRQPGLPVEELYRYEGIRLFVERAAEKQHDFVLSEANAATVLEICRHTDGIPLGIELAAARVGYFPSLTDLLARLERRLPELKRRAPNLPERLRTMRASIAWSYNLLTPNEQALFRTLSVFAGGFTVDAAEEVCADFLDATGEVMPGVESLVDKSLIQPEASTSGSRFRMLETIREFGLEQLEASAEEETVRSALANYFLAMVERAAPELSGPNLRSWLDRLETERDNLRAVLDWSVKGTDGDWRVALALRLASSLWPFWHMRGHHAEAHRWLEQAVALASKVDQRVRAAALLALANIANNLSDQNRAGELYQESLNVWHDLGDRQGEARALVGLGLVATNRGDYDGARDFLRRAGTASDSHVEGSFTVSYLYAWGRLSVASGDYEQAEIYFTEARHLTHRLGQPSSEAYLLLEMARMERERGNLPLAAELAEACVKQFREMGERRAEAAAMTELGLVSARQGSLQQATESIYGAASIQQDLRDEYGIARGLEGLIGLAVVSEHADLGAKLGGATESWRAVHSTARSVAEREDFDRDIAAVQSALGDNAFREAWEVGRTMTLEQTLATARQVLASPTKATGKSSIVQGYRHTAVGPTS